jgi:flagellin
LIDTAIDHVKDHLSDIGGFQRKLTALSTIHSQGMIAEESQASRFGDADLAKEQSEIAKLQLLEQLSLASLAAANIVPAQIIGGIVGR